MSLGREAYEAAMRNADSLADYADFGAGYEQLMYVARESYERLLGTDDDDDRYDTLLEEADEPAITEIAGRAVDLDALHSEPFAGMDIDRAKAVYPRLCAWIVEHGLDY